MARLREAGRTLARGLMLKCPACGRASVYKAAFKMRDRCPACGLVFEREQGYFVGAIYINVIATQGIILLVYLLSLFVTGLDNRVYLLMFALACVLPLIFFRFSRSLWLAVDHIISPQHKPTRIPGRGNRN